MVEINATGDTTLKTSGKYCRDDILVRVPKGSSLDTSDATAKASDILQGKTAYVNGVKIIGTHECGTGNRFYSGNWISTSSSYYTVSEEEGYTTLKCVGTSYINHRVYVTLKEKLETGASYVFAIKVRMNSARKLNLIANSTNSAISDKSTAFISFDSGVITANEWVELYAVVSFNPPDQDVDYKYISTTSFGGVGSTIDIEYIRLYKF